jgi:acyl-CoA synthetase (AMP-forming)/AMP-acid ligase II
LLLGQILDRAVRRVPQKVGLISGEHSYTFRQMGDRVNRLANAFLDMGLNKGDRVAGLLPSTPEFHETFFAAAKAGLVLVPVNYHYLGEEITYAINNVEARALVVDERYLDKVEPIRSRLPSVKHYITVGKSTTTNYEPLIARYPSDSPKVNITHEDLAFILYTSGTTARPKAVMHTHRSAYAFVLACGPLIHIMPEKDICLVTAPSYHIAAALKVITTAYFLDTAIIMESFDPKPFLQTIERYKVTNIFSPLVPAMLIRLLDDPDFGKYDLSSLRSVFIGVNNIPYPLVRRAIKAFGPIVFNLYGSTEGGGVLTLMELGEMRLDLPPDKAKRLESCGREATWLEGEIRVVDDTGKDVVPGEIGEILLRGDGVMKGYWGMPEETARVIDSDGWYHSGDLATVDEDGYIYIKGRTSDIIRSGGENISPVEVEEVIRRHPAVKEVAVIGVPDEYWGEAVKAVVVLKQGEKAGEEEIVEFCKQHLASFKKPRSVDFVDELPVVSSGMMRVARRELRERYRKAANKGGD